MIILQITLNSASTFCLFIHYACNWIIFFWLLVCFYGTKENLSLPVLIQCQTTMSWLGKMSPSFLTSSSVLPFPVILVWLCPCVCVCVWAWWSSFLLLPPDLHTWHSSVHQLISSTWSLQYKDPVLLSTLFFFLCLTSPLTIFLVCLVLLCLNIFTPAATYHTTACVPVCPASLFKTHNHFYRQYTSLVWAFTLCLGSVFGSLNYTEVNIFGGI